MPKANQLVRLELMIPSFSHPLSPFSSRKEVFCAALSLGGFPFLGGHKSKNLGFICPRFIDVDSSAGRFNLVYTPRFSLLPAVFLCPEEPPAMNITPKFAPIRVPFCLKASSAVTRLVQGYPQHNSPGLLRSPRCSLTALPLCSSGPTSQTGLFVGITTRSRISLGGPYIVFRPPRYRFTSSSRSPAEQVLPK